ncbi:MAG: DUF934 domain-containing protein [Gammaproteobacteria bacterium]|nr:DUF934 domain-containing protein [Gammaproteobacteria bacterium]MDD9894640.1 DUF934 domain-containing protein [Gammaproteobacteria bacterium]MDD9960205.1 DUF934 domain-containing protein [Gammaproteobacteria bacterium]
MPKLIKNGEIVQDSWTVLREATGPEVLKAVPGKNFIVPLKFWQLYREDLEDYLGEIALWLDSNENVNDIDADIQQFPLIALNFPVFSDGRSYTNARELRELLNYKGEVRAIGDVLRDQLFYMARCGFDAFEIRHDQDEEACLSAFNDFDNAYQGAIDNPNPLFRRR